MKSDLEICIEIIKKMIIDNKRITIISDNYNTFKEKITQYIYANNLDETKEWKNISDAMIYTSKEWLSLNKADTILINLELLNRINLKNQQEEIIFDKQIHSLISKVCKKKFFDGHYADAVESAFKEINSRCKKIYFNKFGIEKDGCDLMNCIFSPNNPILQFEDIKTETGHNVQLGYMNIFSGSISAIRNPKAHENQKLNKEDAYKRLMFASLLMDKIDEAEEYMKNNETN